MPHRAAPSDACTRQIIDDDTWLVIEQPDAEGSNSDSEDSNAEGFYAHDYPGAPLVRRVWQGLCVGGLRGCGGCQLERAEDAGCEQQPASS